MYSSALRMRRIIKAQRQTDEMTSLLLFRDCIRGGDIGLLRDAIYQQYSFKKYKILPWVGPHHQLEVITHFLR